MLPLCHAIPHCMKPFFAGFLLFALDKLENYFYVVVSVVLSLCPNIPSMNVLFIFSSPNATTPKILEGQFLRKRIGF